MSRLFIGATNETGKKLKIDVIGRSRPSRVFGNCRIVGKLRGCAWAKLDEMLKRRHQSSVTQKPFPICDPLDACDSGYLLAWAREVAPRDIELRITSATSVGDRRASCPRWREGAEKKEGPVTNGLL
jgi:hypothetical protein